MATMFFLNLPVGDLDRATGFYTGLGFTRNTRFSDENASCIVISDTIYVMLLTRPFFATFTSKNVTDPAEDLSGLYALTADSRQDVDALADKAISLGASSAGEAVDHGFMYQRSFHDPDGHLWEIVWMDPTAVEG